MRETVKKGRGAATSSPKLLKKESAELCNLVVNYERVKAAFPLASEFTTNYANAFRFTTAESM